ncbi:hypothetical protein TNCV_4091811 [Trichonephila clavipes]|nr:hypothetical protein TNCV_4091811 [Trichonephila clavipes]
MADQTSYGHLKPSLCVIKDDIPTQSHRLRDCFWSSCAAEQFYGVASWKQRTDEHQSTRTIDSGRRRVMSSRDERHLLRMALNNRTASSCQLEERWSTTAGVLMSDSSNR